MRLFKGNRIHIHRQKCRRALSGLFLCLSACMPLQKPNSADSLIYQNISRFMPAESPSPFQKSPSLNVALPFSAPDKFKVAALHNGTTVQAHNQIAKAYLKRQQVQLAQTNQIFSPFSMSLALHMVSNGAAGTTQHEMLKSLGLSKTALDTLNHDNEILLKSLETAEDQILLRIASSLWLDPIRPSPLDPQIQFQVDFLPGYQDILKERYLAPAQVVDFDISDTPKKINEWVKQATNDKINQIVNENLDPTLIAILLNAIYFNANWKFQFKKADTRPMPFMTSPLKTIQAQTMYLEAPLKGRLADNSQPYHIVELPYGQSDRLVMDIFLPTDRMNLQNMLKDLVTQDVSQWFQAIETIPLGVQLYLPRFKFEQEFALTDWLKSMGIQEIFDPKRADLSLMLRDPHNKDRRIGLAHVSSVIQKALIEVNEEGTEAAAVTIVQNSCSGICSTSAQSGPARIQVDRAFLAIVRDKLTGVILFTALIKQPEVSQ
jgi:serine protease inhibitor